MSHINMKNGGFLISANKPYKYWPLNVTYSVNEMLLL